MAERIRGFRDLIVYQKSFAPQQEIFEISRGFPPEERYSLTDQIRRASRSIGSNIAEAWQKRVYPAHFVSKLTDADAEQAETQHWLDTAEGCGYLTPEDRLKLMDQCLEIGRMLGAMISEPGKWCGR